MSLIGKEIGEFKVQSFVNNEFKEVTKEDVLGKWAVFFFYPADFTFVCPTELEDLADKYEDFKKIGCEIYSVSCDTHFVHKAWHDVSKTIQKIQYPMLADPTGALARDFDVMIEADGLVLDKEKMGGQITITSEIVNYPGVEKTNGTELTEQMRRQAEAFGAEFAMAEITGIDLDGDIRTVKTDKGEYRAPGIVLAVGANPRKLGFVGEREYQGRGVAYTTRRRLWRQLETDCFGARVLKTMHPAGSGPTKHRKEPPSGFLYLPDTCRIRNGWKVSWSWTDRDTSLRTGTRRRVWTASMRPEMSA